MKKLLTIFVFIWLTPLLFKAQDWVSLGGGLNQSECEFLVLDENQLLIAGNFWVDYYSFLEDYDTTVFNGIALWNGEAFSTLTNQDVSPNWAGSVKHPVLFNDQLFFTYNSIHPFEGFEIQRFGMFAEDVVVNPFPAVGRPSAMSVYDDQLIMATKHTAQDGPTFYLWNGTDLDSVSVTNFQTEEVFIDHVDELIVYENQLYGAGTFRYEQGNMHDIFSWSEEDGFSNLNGGLVGAHTHVSCLEVHGNELIIGGQFWQDDGNPTNCIMRWNGTEMLPMGEFGADARVDALKSYGGYLYAAGWFYEMDGIPCRIARWDGSQWEAFDNNQFGTYAYWADNGVFRDLEVFQDELYICGPLSVGEENYVNVAKYVGPLSLELSTNELESSHSTKIYPNPTNNFITLVTDRFFSQDAEVICYDASGRLLFRQTWPFGERQYRLNLSHLTAGLYFVTVETEQGVESHRIVKSEE